jgi:hypothetical protein
MTLRVAITAKLASGPVTIRLCCSHCGGQALFSRNPKPRTISEIGSLDQWRCIAAARSTKWERVDAALDQR